jgi:hypothetical protein
MRLSLGENAQEQQQPQNIFVNHPLNVLISIRSDLDPIRLVSSQIKYDPQMLELIKIEISNTPSSSAFNATSEAESNKNPRLQSLENLFDNKEGKASITGLFDKGDFLTNIKDKNPFRYAKLIFKPKQSGSTELILEDTSVMLRTRDNANVLTKKENLKIDISPEIKK